MPYIPKNYWMICQRTGFKYRRSEMVKEGDTGLWVHRSVANPKHPQEHVKSVPDNPSVSPSFPDVQQTMGETTVAVEARLAGVLTVAIADDISLSKNDVVGVMQDNGVVHWTQLSVDIGGQLITMKEPFTYKVSVGNTVYIPSINSETWA